MRRGWAFYFYKMKENDMRTNFDVLAAGGVEAMRGILSGGDRCGYCAWDKSSEDCMCNLCSDGILLWLESECDSWGELMRDAHRPGLKYWNCIGSSCNNCPAKIKGETPDDYYGVSDCYVASCIDLVCRAKRLAGAEQ